MIKIDFEFQTPHGQFRDALHLPENHEYTNEQIENMKQQRLDNWLAIINNPPQENEIVEETNQSTIEISGETYEKLEGVPPSGAKLLDINGVWYYKVA